LYAFLAKKIRETLPACHIEDFFFETDEGALRLEMQRSGQSEGVPRGWARVGIKRFQGRRLGTFSYIIYPNRACIIAASI